MTANESYVLGPGGEELSMLDGSNHWQRTNVYAAGKLVGTYDLVAGQPALHFQIADPLGSRRIQTDSIGWPEEHFTNWPFGDELVPSAAPNAPPSGGDDATPLHFTGKERDPESGNDYFGARYYASNMGRWLSPDTDMTLKRILPNPQRWNRYAYVINNPLILIDPDGLADTYVFRPLATSNSAAWDAIVAEAPKYGNNVYVFNGSAATAERFETALHTPGANVVDTGHSIENGSGKAIGVLLAGNKGVGDANYSTATDNNGQPGAPLQSPGDVQASTVGVFACNSADLNSVFAPATYTGDRPDTNSRAEDAGAAAYTDTLARNGSAAQAGNAAGTAMVNTTNQVNQLPGNQKAPYAKPQVCTTQNGSTVCH